MGTKDIEQKIVAGKEKIEQVPATEAAESWSKLDSRKAHRLTRELGELVSGIAAEFPNTQRLANESCEKTIEAWTLFKQATGSSDEVEQMDLMTTVENIYRTNLLQNEMANGLELLVDTMAKQVKVLRETISTYFLLFDQGNDAAERSADMQPAISQYAADFIDSLRDNGQNS